MSKLLKYELRKTWALKLIILGDEHTLASHKFYRKLYEYVASLKEN